MGLISGGRVVVFLLVSISVVAICSGGWAADWAFSPGIEIREEYNSNVNLSSTLKLEDYVSIARPKWALSGATEQTKFGFDSILSVEKYIKNSDLDTVNSDNKLSFSHQWTPQLSTALNASIIKDTTLDTQLEEAGIQTTRAERERYDLSLKESYALSESLMLAVTGGGGKAVYEEEIHPDNEYWQAGLEPSWQISSRDTIGFKVNYSHSDFTDSAVIQNLMEGISWQRILNETSSFSLMGGYRTTWTENFVTNLILDRQGRLRFVNQSVDATDDGLTAAATFTKRWTERFNTSFAAGREQYTSSDAESFEHLYLRTTMRYEFSELTALSCVVSYDTNTADDQDREYIRVAPVVERKITKDFSLKLGSSYEHSLEDNFNVESEAERFKVTFALSYQWPRLWANH